MKIYMETTKISVEKTVSEIQLLLVASGATGVMIESKGGQIEAVFFRVTFLDRDIPFRLPCRWEPIYKRLGSRLKKIRQGKEEEMKEQAKRVAWRQILRWVEAQLALVETDMVKVQEVFLPYVQSGIAGQTLYEQIENKQFSMIGYEK